MRSIDHERTPPYRQADGLTKVVIRSIKETKRIRDAGLTQESPHPTHHPLFAVNIGQIDVRYLVGLLTPDASLNPRLLTAVF